jgi:RNA polymerase sigma factor (sigma-70 family)
VSAPDGTEHLLREHAPRVLGALVRRYGHFDDAEDATQEALLAAARQWPGSGIPEDPMGWLTTVASRRLIDRLRSDEALRRREVVFAGQAPVDADASAPVGADADDSLTLLFLCCHPALAKPAQLALTLRAVGGLTTAQIARALLVPEATMAQRISRAKRRLREAGATFAPPAPVEYRSRLDVVLHVLYLVFTEGHTASDGADLHRSELTREAIRLTRMLHRLLPDDGEVAGLLALMLLTEARAGARTTADGDLVPLAEQDRSRWSRPLIDEGIALITRTLGTAPVGAYQVQAAIAAVHAEAPHPDATDWRQIVALYEVLGRLAPNPMVTLNHAVAVAMAHGPRVGLAMLDALDEDARVAGHHRLSAVRAHLLELAGDTEAARRAFLEAARRTTSVPERRYLERRAATRPASAPRRRA